MISTEKTLDMLPAAIEIWEKLDIENWYKANDFKDKSQDEAGLLLIKFLLKNTSKIKNEICEVIAIMEDKTSEDIKAQPITDTFKSLTVLLNDPELVGFFKQAVQSGTLKH